MPRKTLTPLDPVTLPTEASAYRSWTAATLLANVSARHGPGVGQWHGSGQTSTTGLIERDADRLFRCEQVM